MTYFKTRGRRPFHVHPIDQRVIEAVIDPPRWWQEQLDLVAEKTPSIDLGAECPGDGPSRREFRGFVIEVAGRETSRIVMRHGKNIDRVTLTSPDGEALLNYIRSQPDAPRRRSKKD